VTLSGDAHPSVLQHVFHAPTTARWVVLAGHPHSIPAAVQNSGHEINETIDDATVFIHRKGFGTAGSPAFSDEANDGSGETRSGPRERGQGSSQKLVL
jgi:hypothetical protein